MSSCVLLLYFICNHKKYTCDEISIKNTQRKILGNVFKLNSVTKNKK